MKSISLITLFKGRLWRNRPKGLGAKSWWNRVHGQPGKILGNMEAYLLHGSDSTGGDEVLR